MIKQSYEEGDFKLVCDNVPAGILYDKDDCKLVEIAADNLRKDIERVTGSNPAITTNAEAINNDIVIIAPWDFKDTERGDIIWRFTLPQVEWLKENNHIPKDF